jgi:hypothetical protein
MINHPLSACDNKDWSGAASGVAIGGRMYGSATATRGAVLASIAATAQTGRVADMDIFNTLPPADFNGEGTTRWSACKGVVLGLLAPAPHGL